MNVYTLLLGLAGMLLTAAAIGFVVAAAIVSRAGDRKYDEGYADAEATWKLRCLGLEDKLRTLMRFGPDAPWEDRPALAPRHARTKPRQEAGPPAGAPRFHIVPRPMPAPGAYPLIASFPGSQPSGVKGDADTDMWKYTTGEMKALTDEEFIAALESK